MKGVADMVLSARIAEHEKAEAAVARLEAELERARAYAFRCSEDRAVAQRRAGGKT